MRISKSFPKKLQSLSPQKEQTSDHILSHHRQQIQSTLTHLHKLQSQIYELNVPENPHSVSPVKKQIKQLAYLYENMTKPREKNSLNVSFEDIQLALRVINGDWTPDTRLQSQNQQNIRESFSSTKINLFSKTQNISSRNQSPLKHSLSKANKDISYKVDKKLLKQKYQALTEHPLAIQLVTRNQKSQTVSTQQIYDFINYSETQDFDPLKEAYEIFLNPEGLFDLEVYNRMNEALGLPRIKNVNTFMAAIEQQGQNNILGNQDLHQSNQSKNQTNKQGSMTVPITLAQFRSIVQLKLQ